MRFDDSLNTQLAREIVRGQTNLHRRVSRHQVNPARLSNATGIALALSLSLLGPEGKLL